MQHFSAELDHMGLARLEIMTMKGFFDQAKQLPMYLVTQNKPLMKKAYVSVPADIWSRRIVGLQHALTESRIPEGMRRSFMVASGPAGMSPLIDDMLDAAFREKYEELIPRVLHDFHDFFPYRVTRTNPNIMIFEKMQNLSMIEYVLKRI